MVVSVTVRSRWPIAVGQLRARTVLANSSSIRRTNRPPFFAGGGALRSLSTTSKHTAITDELSLSKRILELPLQYLRAMDSTNYDPVTLQRTDFNYDGHTGKPLLPASPVKKMQKLAVQDCKLVKDDEFFYEIKWSDGLVSRFSKDWVDEQLSHWKGVDETDMITSYSSSSTSSLQEKQQRSNDRVVLWSGLTEEMVRLPSSSLCIPFDQAIRDDEGMLFTLRALYTHGIVLVTDTPLHDQGAGVAALAASLGGGSVKDNNNTSLLASYKRYNNNRDSNPPPIVLPRGTDGPLRTLYGTVWSTTTAGQDVGTSVADSAYGHDGLPLHTDMTYHRDPPGLQIFTMVQPAAQGGGASIFGDGFAAAAALRKAHPDAFAILSQTVRRYRSVDLTTGWHLEASGPVIQLDHTNNRVVMIRHNDLDRLADLPPPPSVLQHDSEEYSDVFYQRLEEAHAAWDGILARDDMRLEMSLQPGDTMVVANQVRVCACAVEIVRGFDRATVSI